MPTYVYRCNGCGHTAEIRHAMDYSGQPACDQCAGKMTKVPTCPAVVLDWKNLDYDDGALAQAAKRFRGSAVPASIQ